MMKRWMGTKGDRDECATYQEQSSFFSRSIQKVIESEYSTRV